MASNSSPILRLREGFFLDRVFPLTLRAGNRLLGPDCRLLPLQRLQARSDGVTCISSRTLRIFRQRHDKKPSTADKSSLWHADCS
jgi:hypothetical protein